jgi:glycosyltransferase involved in cell wall biosynthesis
VGGNSHIVRHGYNGFLCKPQDHSDISEKLKILMDNPLLLNDMRRQARTTILNRFSLLAMVNRYERLYEALAVSPTPVSSG